MLGGQRRGALQWLIVEAGGWIKRVGIGGCRTMGLNLALEASNNSQIVFSLREWEKKLRGRKGKKGPRLGQVPAGNDPKLQGGGGGALASCFGRSALLYQMICRQASGLAAPLCRILLAAAGRLSSGDPPNGSIRFGFDTDAGALIAQASVLALLHGCSMLQRC